jgi:uncharacterized Zn finger protein
MSLWLRLWSASVIPAGFSYSGCATCSFCGSTDVQHRLTPAMLVCRCGRCGAVWELQREPDKADTRMRRAQQVKSTDHGPTT